MNPDRWVEDQVASLEAARDWRPDAARAFARLRQRDRLYLARRRRWALIAAAASMACLSVLAAPGRCDSPGSKACVQPLGRRLWDEVFYERVAAGPIPVNFKETGSPDAPITLEIYADYECPPCGSFWEHELPRLMEQYVRTGKVKLVHRDLPLQVHAHARLAARYANAAGRLGEYDRVVEALFRTQGQWKADGDIDRQLAQVLAPGLMEKVRSLVRDDPALDDSVTSDQNMAARDNIRSTPGIVVVSKGRRQTVPGVPGFDLLKSDLDRLLAEK